VATATAEAIAKELYDILDPTTGDPSATTVPGAAKSDIDGILSKYSVNPAKDISAIKAALKAKVMSVASAAAATTTGACYYQVGGAGSYCSNNVTKADCDSLGGYFTPGQNCMVMVYQALFAEGLLDPPAPTAAKPGVPRPGAVKI
jgi:hypothetical protein